MASTTVRSGLLIALLITLATTATAVVGGPDPGEGEMAVTGHSSTSTSGSAGASQSSRMDEHITDISLDFSFAGDDPGIPVACQEDIRKARASGQDRVCTDQAATMRCPHDNETIVMAPNGCVISSLQGQGWQRAPLNAGEDDEAPSVTLSGKIAFRTGGYQVQTDSWTEDGTAMFTINVSAPGPNETVIQALTTEQIDVTEDSGAYNSAEAIVYIDGEQLYSRSETQESDHIDERPPRPSAGPPATRLAHRVKMLEQRIAMLERQVTVMTEILQEAAPEQADRLEDTPSTPLNYSVPGMTPDQNTSDEAGPEAGPRGPGGPSSQPGNASPPSSGIVDAIRGIFR